MAETLLTPAYINVYNSLGPVVIHHDDDAVKAADKKTKLDEMNGGHMTCSMAFEVEKNVPWYIQKVRSRDGSEIVDTHDS